MERHAGKARGSGRAQRELPRYEADQPSTINHQPSAFLVTGHRSLATSSGRAQILLVRCIRNDTVTHVPRLLPAVFFQTETGREPVREWLLDLPKPERKMIGIDIMTVQFRWPLGMPLVRNIGSSLYEIRSNLPTRIARTLFFVHQGEIVLLHGFVKKTRKTPKEDRALALQRKNAYVKSSKK